MDIPVIILLNIFFNIHKAFGIVFPNQPLILSLGIILSRKIRFPLKIILTLQLFKKCEITCYGNQIFQGKIQTLFNAL